MLMLHLLAEQRIEEAMREGAFDDLPGTGRPLELDDDRWVPQDSRVAFRILKNAGFVPPEIQTRKEIADLNRLLATVTDDGSAIAPARALRCCRRCSTTRVAAAEVTKPHAAAPSGRSPRRRGANTAIGRAFWRASR